MRWICLAMATWFVAGCTSTTADFEAKSMPTIQNFAENYQEIYRRISTTARRCSVVTFGTYSAVSVNADLFSELGYGEVSAFAMNYNIRSFYWTARVDRAGKGATVTVRADSVLPLEQGTLAVMRWAANDQNC